MSPVHRPRLNQIEGSRFCAILSIVLYHIVVYGAAKQGIWGATQCAKHAVCYFVVLSGFTTHYACKQTLLTREFACPGTNWRRIVIFYIQRVDRIAFLACLTTAGVLICAAVVGDPQNFFGRRDDLQHLALCFTMTATFFDASKGCPNQSLWFIGSLLVAWTVYPATQQLLQFLESRAGVQGLLSFAVLIWGAHCWLVSAVVSTSADPSTQFTWYFKPWPWQSSFIIGAVASAVCCRLAGSSSDNSTGKDKRYDEETPLLTSPAAAAEDIRNGFTQSFLVRWALPVLADVFALLEAFSLRQDIVLTVDMERWVPLAWMYSSSLLFAGYLICSCTSIMTGGYGGMLARLLSHPVLVGLGGYSFHVYVLHLPLLQTSLIIMPDHWLFANANVLFLVLVITLAGFYAELIEKPLIPWLRKYYVPAAP